jgi:hypothetical protein
LVDAANGTKESETVPTIRDLIRAATDDEGRTFRQLEQDSGYLVKFQTFQDLANNAPKEFPKKTSTITGMAQALRITEAAVVLAYAKGLGIPIEGLTNTFALRLPSGVSTIEPDMQNAIINMARAAVKRHRLGPNPDADPL